MRTFGQTNGAQAPKDAPASDFARPAECLLMPFTALSRFYYDGGQFGPQWILHVCFDTDPESEWSMGFSNKSPAYGQIETLSERDFPFRAMIEPAGRSYRLADPTPEAVAATTPQPPQRAAPAAPASPAVSSGNASTAPRRPVRSRPGMAAQAEPDDISASFDVPF